MDQTEWMLIISSICLIVTILTLFIKFDSRIIKISLIIMELSSFLLLRFNRLALLYQGSTDQLSFTMTRVSFFGILFCMFMELGAFNLFLRGFVTADEIKRNISRRLFYAGLLLGFGSFMTILNLFNGFIYSLDEGNNYVRGPGFLLCNILFLAVILLQQSVIISCHTTLRKYIRRAMLAYTIFAIFAALLQYLIRGVSFNSFTFAFFGIVLHACANYENGKKVEEARQQQMELLKSQNELLQHLLSETTTALAGAIDAKDKYTHGHSRRVAEYARRIAQRAGKSGEECNCIYLAGLLHDVGKIGVPGSIINKPSRLTDEEFEKIKEHPQTGSDILSSIAEVPYLRESALCHHERYDGKGYPNHLKGEEIPEFARIIAVADSYDAMTSNRSYRGVIPQEKVRSEIEKGRGTQFDPKFADCMLQMIDEDKNYEMHE